MKLFVAVGAFAVMVLLVGCNKKDPTQKTEPSNTETQPKPADTEPKPTPSDPSKKPSGGLTDHGPWVMHDDPTFTAEFPSKSAAPKQDTSWEKQISAVSGIKDVQVVTSRAGDWNCKVTVYPTVPLPEEFEKDPGKALEKYLPGNRKKDPAKELKVDGKFAARQVLLPGPMGASKCAAPCTPTSGCTSWKSLAS